MTTTITVLTLDPAGAAAIVNALSALGADVQLDESAPGYLAVLDPAGVRLFSIETPSLIHVPGEARRLLGRDEPGLPYWWLDLHIPADAPPSGRSLAQALARTLAEASAHGVVSSKWTQSDASPDPGGQSI